MNDPWDDGGNTGRKLSRGERETKERSMLV